MNCKEENCSHSTLTNQTPPILYSLYNILSTPLHFSYPKNSCISNFYFSMAPRLSVAILGVVLAILAALTAQAEAGRAFFVFGDSLVDNGNNNYLATTARADSYPYGIDFPTHRPTGRFSNGLNIPDYISWVHFNFIFFFFVPVFSLFFFY